ncbi:hypothetical protein B0T24DRAFT_600214 [Lasiosphaeria ovina]|uniref:Uncharacterized protein n=1 Tax=Lasiosphaeria ovina TaxID=92902 RepID=A0AAE0JRW9_9PEZI|nr:hypothetical protein B0T24DRAFT_600214 [Lasiosphaeria ovina]
MGLDVLPRNRTDLLIEKSTGCPSRAGETQQVDAAEGDGGSVVGLADKRADNSKSWPQMVAEKFTTAARKTCDCRGEAKKDVRIEEARIAVRSVQAPGTDRYTVFGRVSSSTVNVGLAMRFRARLKDPLEPSAKLRIAKKGKGKPKKGPTQPQRRARSNDVLSTGDTDAERDHVNSHIEAPMTGESNKHDDLADQHDLENEIKMENDPDSSRGLPPADLSMQGEGAQRLDHLFSSDFWGWYCHIYWSR